MHLAASLIFLGSSSKEVSMPHNAGWSNLTAKRCRKKIDKRPTRRFRRSDRACGSLSGGSLHREPLRPGFPLGHLYRQRLGLFCNRRVPFAHRRWSPPSWGSALLPVGIMGGYATFSTYTHETLQLIQDGELGTATFNTIGQVVAGLTAVYLGVVLGWVLGGT